MSYGVLRSHMSRTSTTPISTEDQRFYSLDFTRAIAALAVVLLHWGALGVHGERPPLENGLMFFYHFGAFSVPLFFSLSGFIFTWLYARPVHTGLARPAAFFTKRFARLYPLYFITFIISGILVSIDGPPQGFQFERLYVDPYHFVLNLFMLTGWGFEDGFSFNAPSWSVSTELFLYIVFFLAARTSKLGIRSLLVFVIVGIVFTVSNVRLGGGVAQFFSGAVAFRLYEMWRRQPRRRWIFIAISAAVVLVALYAIEWNSHPIQFALIHYGSLVPRFDARYQIIRDLLFPTVLFPLVIFTQASCEHYGIVRNMARHPAVKWAGDLSYSIYLWHFPLALCFIAYVRAAGLPDASFDSLIVLALYLAILVSIAHLSFYSYEKPVMKLLRSFGRPDSKGEKLVA